MLDSTKTTYLYERIKSVYSDIHQRSVAKLCAEIRNILQELYSFLTEDELQFFSSLYSKQIYITDRFNLTEDVSDLLHKLRVITGNRYKNRNELSTEDCIACLYVLQKAISQITGIAPDNSLLSQSLPIRFTQRVFSESAEILHLIRGIVQSVSDVEEVSFRDNTRKYSTVTIETDEQGLLQIHLWDEHCLQSPYLWKGATLHVFEVKRSKEREQQYSTTRDSLIVLEPDILLDVTSVAECFQNNTAEPLLYFVSKFIKSKTSKAMVIGSIINYCLDELLANPDIDFDVMFTNALRVKPLNSLVGIPEGSDEFNDVQRVVREQVVRLQSVIQDFKFDKLSTEPTFISPLYGLQGRLDILLEFEDSLTRKTVIELKSGSAPNPSYGYNNTPNTIISSGMWTNHLAQVTGYNLLLDSAFPHRTGDSQVLYSKTDVFPLRNAPNIHSLKQLVLSVRNAIINYEHQLTERKFGFLQKLHPKKIALPPFKVQEVHQFSTLYQHLTQSEKFYIHAFISFLQREQFSQRVGASVGNGYAALWLETDKEKEERFSLLSGLSLNLDVSDFKALHIRLDFTINTQRNSVFRVGDIAVVYPMNQSNDKEIYQAQITKCSVREITDDYIVVSIRNKQLESSYFNGTATWCIEPDFVETSYNNVYSSLIEVFSLPEGQKSLLLGKREPCFTEYSFDFDDSLSEEQKHILTKALTAQDYFLLQGPPGTGKTSVMLKNAVNTLLKDPNESILLTAFTNRAVDEICTSLKRIEPQIEFIRLGSKENTIHTDVLLQTHSENCTLHDLRDKVIRTRVIVGTLSFLHTNPELFSLKKFTTAIVDEASQIIEPMLIGMLSNVNRFILIGDEKQLPAVVTQQERGCMVQHELLAELEITDLRISYFERLLRLCIKNGWDNAYGMLSKQGRMHQEIQEYSSTYFYQNKLDTINLWQKDEDTTLLFNKRMVFIPSEKEHAKKYHRQEAMICSEIVQHILLNYTGTFTNDTIGIITPFRAQIREIMLALPSEVKSKISVDTVERYQGSERDIIIISSSINSVSQLNSLQSLSEFNGILVDRKLNVALTRAKKQCIILGVPEILEQSVQYRKLIEQIKENGGYMYNYESGGIS